MFERFDIDDRNIFKVCVVATMSSGKSTFINSIIGEEIMPEKNEACTARTMAVLDNDSIKTKRAHIIRKNGAKEIVELDSKEVLERVNNDEDVVDFVIETNIQSIPNTSKALMLVDTPGVNNSEDEKHGIRTEEFLQQLDSGVIIYLMNATQLATNDDALLLQYVSEHVKKQNGNVKIFFVINKIDALDTETESISGTVAIAKEYIEKHGIMKPIIYPMSALAAKSLRMALYRREMTRREIRKLEDIYDNYQSKDNNMMAYAMADELSGETYEIGDVEITAQELQRAIDNTGITAVEKKIESYMREIEKHFSPEVIIKATMSESAAQKYQKRLDDIILNVPSDIEKKYNKLSLFIEKDRLLTGLNYSLGMAEEGDIELECYQDLTLVNDQFEMLVQNIEKTKKKFVDEFTNDNVIKAQHKNGVYFFPTNIEKEKINVKMFFFISLDGKKWTLMKFGEVSKYIEEKKEFYICNMYEPFVYKAQNINVNDIIPLMDIRVPIRLIEIAGFQKSLATITEIEEYINHLSIKDAEQQKEIHETEEKLKRTYKGVLLNSEKEKNDVIKLESEVEKFCQEINKYSFEEIFKYKEKIDGYPNVIFAQYLTRLISGLDIQANREKNIYLDKIEMSNLDELNGISEEIRKHNYSNEIISVLNKNINIRKLQCQRTILDSKIRNIGAMNRKELVELQSEIRDGKFATELVDEYSEKIQRQYDTREVQELRQLCANINQCDIDGLFKLEQRIKQAKYREEHTAQYIEIIHLRIEHLHLQNIEELCRNVESVDRNTLNLIRKAIEDENCKTELKKAFFERIDKREEEIDYEDLCLLTSELENKTVDELRGLLNEIYSGKYNDKFIKSFQVRIRVALERAQYRYLQILTNNIEQMNKEELQKIVDHIKCEKYEERVVSLINTRIVERMYELDMYQLMNLRNEFDGMSLEDIDLTRRMVKEMDVCQRSKDTYFKKLNMREYVIGYEMVSSLACLAKQTIDSAGLGRVLSVKIATFSADYCEYLNKHFEMLGKCEYDDIPIFIIPDCSFLALNKKTLFWKSSTGYKEIRLDTIQSIKVEKKLFSEYVSISLVNGNYVSLTSGINKYTSNALVSVLTYLVQNIENKAILSQYKPYQDKIFPLKKEDFEINNVACEVTSQVIAGLLIDKMAKLSKIIRMSSIKYASVANWTVLENKVLTAFGINKEKHIVLYYDRTLLNSAKEGIALGECFIHLKSANQSLVSIPYCEIFDVDFKDNCLRIRTVQNTTFTPEFTMVNVEDGKKIARYINEYVKGIQFVEFALTNLAVGEKQFDEVQELEKECPVCNSLVKRGTRFCSQCGNKMEDEMHIKTSNEFIFCTECGNKIVKGKKFCSNCGCKVD